MEKLKELRKIVKFCQKNGIITLKMDGFEFSMIPGAMTLAKGRSKSQPEQSIASNVPTDFTLWSAPDLPQEDQPAH